MGRDTDSTRKEARKVTGTRDTLGMEVGTWGTVRNRLVGRRGVEVALRCMHRDRQEDKGFHILVEGDSMGRDRTLVQMPVPGLLQGDSLALHWWTPLAALRDHRVWTWCLSFSSYLLSSSALMWPPLGWS